MVQEEKYYLCSRCKDKRDWANDPHVKSVITVQQEKPEKERHRCIRCRYPLNNIFFKLHVGCAKKEKLCQCCSSILKTEEDLVKEEAEEVYEAAVDFFTLLVKSYRISEARLLVQESGLWENDPRVSLTLKEITPTELDKRTDRPVWQKVLTGQVKRVRYCPDCSPFSPYPKAISRALNSECGHLVVGEKAEWCALCAADRFVCEICGVSVR